MKVEIEAPTEKQKARAKAQEMVSFAELDPPDYVILKELRERGMTSMEAQAALPSIKKAARKGRNRKRMIRFVVGGFMAAVGFGWGFFLLIGGVFVFWAFLLGAVGVALMLNKIDRPSDHL